jgi:hypothetical protein
LAVASPMPLFPPVITATFPSSLFMTLSFLLRNCLTGVSVATTRPRPRSSLI